MSCCCMTAQLQGSCSAQAEWLGLLTCRFILDDMLSLQGNTAVYLLYAHARIVAIGRKAGIENIAALAHEHALELDHERERALAMHVS